MMMSFTSDVMIFPNAPPTITPTARSSTLPRSANSLNSFSIARSSYNDRHMIVDEMQTTGDVLFRWRSYMPLVLLPLFGLTLLDDRPSASFSFEVLCFCLALAGLLL